MWTNILLSLDLVEFQVGDIAVFFFFNMLIFLGKFLSENKQIHSLFLIYFFLAVFLACIMSKE